MNTLLKILAVIFCISLVGYLLSVYVKRNPETLIPLIKYKAEINTENGLSLPAELSSAFDVTQNPPRFMVVDGQETTATSLMLKIVFPQSRSGEEINREIACPSGDMAIVSQINGKVKQVTLEEFVNEAQARHGIGMISALCSDDSCKKLASECKLYVGDDL